MTNPLTRPMPFEVITGWGETRRVIHSHSLKEAEAEFRRLWKAGARPSIWIGDLCLKGD